MMRLITDLLDASAIEHGRLAVERTPENMGTLIGDALDLLRPLPTNKSVQIRLELPSGEPARVFCDRDRLLQVLSNLIGNAIKFSPEMSTIAVKEEHTERAVRVSVRDGGPGIEGLELAHVFERHWHTKPSAGGGSGLGLFIAKGIVEAHDGTIGVKSEVGTGSTFFFELPIRQEISHPTLVDRIRHSSARL
jgi:signal transduction histidine kinase